jgi:hypothetical protein
VRQPGKAASAVARAARRSRHKARKELEAAQDRVLQEMKRLGVDEDSYVVVRA